MKESGGVGFENHQNFVVSFLSCTIENALDEMDIEMLKNKGAFVDLQKFPRVHERMEVLLNKVKHKRKAHDGVYPIVLML